MEFKLGVKIDRDKNRMPKLTDGTYRFSVLLEHSDMVMMEVRGFKATKNFDGMSFPSTLLGRGLWYAIVTAEAPLQQYLLGKVEAEVNADPFVRRDGA